MGDWFKERAKSFAGALAGGIAAAFMNAFEKTIGLDVFSIETETLIIGGAVGFATQQAVYWTSNKPMDPKP